MTIKRMEHVGIVVEDLEAATAFFVELGFELQGTGSVEGDWVERIVGLENILVEIAMLKMPDGHGGIELVKFLSPETNDVDQSKPANTTGLRHLALVVDDVQDTIARLRPHGAEMVGSIENYEDVYLLCYVRGPEGIILELIEEIG